jgi:hypothetical protein
MANLEPLLIGGRSALPEITIAPGRVGVTVFVGMEEHDELLGSAIYVQVIAGETPLVQVGRPAPGRPLSYAATAGATARAEFAFANPRNLTPTELIVTIAGHAGMFDLSDSAPIVSAPAPQPETSFRITLLRPDDLLNLEIEAVNLRVDDGDAEGPVLVPLGGRGARLIVHFPPQTTAEEAFFEAGGTEQKTDSAIETVRQNNTPLLTPPPSAPGQAAARMSGPTRLVFRVPGDARIPFTIQGLLTGRASSWRSRPLPMWRRTPSRRWTRSAFARRGRTRPASSCRTACISPPPATWPGTTRAASCRTAAAPSCGTHAWSSAGSMAAAPTSARPRRSR